ncbi:MAG TPA: DUF2147 domain-containing protein [Chitinophagales bacterium]|nr:DUF2147 domain-containing protein [Chitinophagales bacterium]HNE46615.1 DUF2147 domain-containing protein [Chitinophagales bacterium]
MRLTLAMICAFMVTMSAKAQNWQDNILGGWINGDKDAKVEIYVKDGKYYGKITWLRNPNEEDGTPKVDDENPDESKQKEPIMGLVILKGFDFVDGMWKNGTIYDPKNGKTYKCEMWLDGKELKIRGYWGIVYRTETWTKPK